MNGVGGFDAVEIVRNTTLFASGVLAEILLSIELVLIFVVRTRIL